MKEYKFDISTGISAVEDDYLFPGTKKWYYITYPSFGYVDTKRIFPNTKYMDIQAFRVAYQVVMVTCFWPIEAFDNFMKRVEESGIDVELVFSGRKPPLTSYMLDDVIQEAKTYKKTIKLLDKIRPTIPIKFHPTCFCGSDAQFHPTAHVSSSHHDRFAKHLEPPKKIKDMEAERKLREAIEQLGMEKCKELMV